MTGISSGDTIPNQTANSGHVPEIPDRVPGELDGQHVLAVVKREQAPEVFFMFSTIKKSRYVRWVAAFLTFTITLTFSYTLGGVRAAAAGKDAPRLKIAVIGIENLTDRELLKQTHGIDILLSELSDIEDVDLVPSDKIEESLAGRAPNPDMAIGVGRDVGADAVIVGFVSDLNYGGTEQAALEVGLSMYAVNEGNLLSEVVVTGRATRLGFTGSLEQLAELAIRDGVRNAVGFLFENLTRFGVVTMIQGNTVMTNMSTRDNVRVGAELAILRDNRQIASIEIKDVSVAHSQGNIIDQSKGVTVQAGDKTRLVYTPAEASVTSGGAKKIPKKSKLSPILIAVIAAGVIVAVSSGGNKAEAANVKTGAATMASADGKAVVYSPSPFDSDYIPAPPVSLPTASTTSTLSNCYKPSNLIDPLWGTAYDFHLSTSPRTSTLPGIGYTLIFNLKDVPSISTIDKSRLRCATCDTDNNEWEIINGTYGKRAEIGNSYGLSCPVTHFTPYVVVVDNRVDPLPAPSNFTVQCGDGAVTLNWDTIDNDNATGYKIWECSSTECSTVKETITDASQSSVEYTVTNDVQACYAIEGTSSNQNQDADRSVIVCTTPSADASVCKIEAITLISPTNGSNIETETPQFVFQGSGTMDYYILYVQDTENDKDIMFTSAPLEGEGAEGTERGRYEVAYSNGSNFSTSGVYKWWVKGFTNSKGNEMTSSTWSFTYMGGSSGTCCALATGSAPDPLIPANGATIQTATPILSWTKVDCASSYIVTVRNQNGQQVFQQIVNNTNVTYGGVALVDNVTYSWEIIADNGCGEYAYGSTFTFTKISPTEVTDLPVPEWVSGTGNEPLIGGDKLISLRWYEEADDKVIGYAVYRGTDSTSLSLVDIVYKTQLGGPLPDSDCPVQFTESSPGYCDISVTNGEQYFYKLACIQTGDLPGTRSVVQSIQLGLNQPQLIGPGAVSATSMTDAAPQFLWNSVDGNNVSYILTLTNTTTGLVIWNPYVSNASGNIISLNYNGPTLEIGTVYKWVIKALNGKVESQDSQVFKFTKAAQADKPDAPEWCSGCMGQQSDWSTPDDSGSGVTLYWAMPTSANISKFRIYRCVNQAGTCANMIAETGKNACIIGTTTLDHVVCYDDTHLDRGMTYYYNIKAVDSGDTESDPSETKSTSVSLQGPSLSFPVYGQVVYEPQPTFSWQTESGADRYYLYVVRYADGHSEFSDASKFVWSYTTTDTSAQFNVDDAAKEALENPSDPTSSTQYSWRVCSANADYPDSTAYCAKSMFYKNLKVPKTVSPSLEEKIVKDDVNPVKFKWTASPGAAGYTLRLCKQSGSASASNCALLPIVYQTDISGYTTTSLDLPASIDLGICDTVNDPDCSDNGAYMWEIRAYDDYGQVSGVWTNLLGLKFYVVGHEAPKLITPTNGQVIQPNLSAGITTDFYGSPSYEYDIMFQWGEISQAGTYMMRIESIEATEGGSGTATHTVTIFEKTETTPFDSSTDQTLKLAAGQHYRWNVTTTGTDFDEDNVSDFYTGLPAPYLVAPVDGQQLMLADCAGLSAALCVHFDWNGGIIDDANGNPMQVQGVIGASGYDVQILDNSVAYECAAQFTPPAMPNPPPTHDTFCDLSSTSPVNGDVFQWRVRARDSSGEPTSSGTGIPGVWSSYHSFTVLIPAVVLSSPPDNLNQCDPYNFPEQIQAYCTIVDCVDMSYYWSPITYADSTSCYRIEISDSPDFSNLVWADNSESAINPFKSVGTYLIGYTAGHGGTTMIPMTNGVVYYWRVGASVKPTSGDCGTSWVYSDTWEYFKRPPMPTGLTVTTSDADPTTANLTWSVPVNCSDGTSPAVSTPTVPPDGGSFVLYLEDALPDVLNPPTHIIGHPGKDTTNASIGNLTADTDYVICIATVDASGFVTHVGHVSDYSCTSVHTPAEPTD
jgi:hypothetical protein